MPKLHLQFYRFVNQKLDYFCIVTFSNKYFSNDKVEYLHQIKKIDYLICYLWCDIAKNSALIDKMVILFYLLNFYTIFLSNNFII